MEFGKLVEPPEEYFGEGSTVELESYLRTAAEQVFDVDNAEVHPELEPLNQG
ncbi:MAG: hypothetical protein OXE87_04855 [Chloroflexi bacterium]|nr:hypothetical protein [Chloroflexota bacterium]